MLEQLQLGDAPPPPPVDERLRIRFNSARLSLRPPPRRRMSEWAEEKFYLSPESAAEPGRWRCMPYQVEVLNAFSDPLIESVAWMKSARVGYTKCVDIVIGYHIEYDPCPILVIQPTLEDAEGFSKEELAPMIRDVPALRGVVSDAKAKDGGNTIHHKTFPGGSVSIVGANSPRGFRRVSRRVVLFDEVDGYPASAGTEGDPIKLGIRRTDYYWNRKIAYGSTPTIAGRSRIEKLFEAGDQRRYYVPCPHCGYMDYLVFSGNRNEDEERPRGHFMAWPKDRPEDAYFVCRDCGAHIEHRHKRQMVTAGEWRAAKPFTGHASFHIWAAYSFSPNASWGQIAAEFVAANKEGHESLKTFVNTVLGETWKEKGEAPDYERLYERRDDYPQGSCPLGVLFLTCGVDVQKDRLMYEIVGWGRGKRSWSIDIGIIPGETSGEAPWRQIDAMLSRMYQITETGHHLAIGMLAVDSGYNTQTVYNWARQHPMTRVIAVKGKSTDAATMLVGSPSPVDVTIRGQKIKEGYKVWPVATGVAKGELYGWLKLRKPTEEARLQGAVDAPGFCRFPQYDEEYFRQLTAEQLVPIRRRGQREWTWLPIPNRENHFLDARVYARAAAFVLGLDRFRESDWTALEKVTGQHVPPPGGPPSTGGPKGRFGRSKYLGNQ